jgi:hypothetical protein
MTKTPKATTDWETTARVIMTVEDDEQGNPRVIAIHVLSAQHDLTLWGPPEPRMTDEDEVNATIERHARAFIEDTWPPLADLPASVIWEG